MKIKLTPAFVMKAKVDDDPAFVQRVEANRAKADRTTFWDKSLSGFGLVVTVTGHRNYAFQYRDPSGKDRRMKIDFALGLSNARKEAEAMRGTVAKGGDPLGEKRKTKAKATNTLQAIAENYLKREGKNLRSIGKRRSVFDRNIFPAFGSLPIESIRRSNITALLDRIEEKNGPAAANETLAFLSRLFTWHASRGDEFRSPIVRGMAKPTKGARQRVLSDEELRAV
jgi:hypothetical protein